MRTDGPIDVLFLVLPETLLLDLAGPAETFRLANQQLQRRGQPPAFRLRYVGASEQATTSVGLQVAGLEPLPAALPPRSWIVLMGRPGPREMVLRTHHDGWMAARHWLATVAAPALVGTGLGVWLTQQGIRRVIVAGIRTEQCCETTTRHASDEGWDVDFVGDATLTFDMKTPAGAPLPAALIRERTESVLVDRFAKLATVDEALARA